MLADAFFCQPFGQRRWKRGLDGMGVKLAVELRNQVCGQPLKGFVLDEADRFPEGEHVTNFKRDVGVEDLVFDPFKDGHAEVAAVHVGLDVGEHIVVVLTVVRPERCNTLICKGRFDGDDDLVVRLGLGELHHDEGCRFVVIRLEGGEAGVYLRRDRRDGDIPQRKHL